MDMFYKISIGGIIFLGLAHIIFTFKKFKKIEPDAMWFSSAGIALLAVGSINYLNIEMHSPVSFKLAVSINILLVIFSILLVYSLKRITTFSLLVVALCLLISSALYMVV